MTLNWLLFGVALFVLVIVVGFASRMLADSLPAPENRPAPPERIADLEEARDAALRRLAARARAQDQREAAARISRGW